MAGFFMNLAVPPGSIRGIRNGNTGKKALQPFDYINILLKANGKILADVDFVVIANNGMIWNFDEKKRLLVENCSESLASKLKLQWFRILGYEKASN